MLMMHLAWQLELTCDHCKGSMIISELPWSDYNAEPKIPLAQKAFECPTCHRNLFQANMRPTLVPDTVTSIIIKDELKKRSK